MRMFMLVFALVQAVGAVFCTAKSLNLIARYFPGATLWNLFTDATIVIKQTMTLNVILALASLVIAIVTRNDRKTALRIVAFAAPGLGLFGAGYGYLNIQRAIAVVGPTSLAATAPGYAEAWLGAAFGLAAGAIAAAGAAWVARNPKP